ncbi:hypothetical protein DERF_003207 [Dermatophagoides farinae]|uniref:Uncharacterized protein n=2 Tax=Dermatophagoides farinae TaxID=6954 RepID=A0A922LAC3_DERFA|nr:hypothetical protein DERF_003207 [Dermatophagoides farinae]
MNPKRIILLFVLNFINLTLVWYSVNCARIIRRQPIQPVIIPNEFAVIAPQPLQVHRQSQHLFPSIFSGPLALAAFLFTIPLLPSLIMAPMAMAGLPSAFNVFTSMVSGLTNGKPIQSLIDPLYMMNLGNQSDILNQPIRRQLNVMRSIAKTFRVVMNKRYAQPVVTPNEAPIPELSNIPDKIENEMANQIEGLTSAVSSTLSNNDNNNSSSPETNYPADNILKGAGSSSEDGQMEKSIKGMDLLYTSLRDIYSIIRNGLRRYEITDTECQSRIVCEIHQKIISHNKLLKTFSVNALDVLNLEKHIDSWSSLNQKSKESIKFYINAAKKGFADKDCNKEFRNCPTLGSRQFRRFIFNRNSLLNPS